MLCVGCAAPFPTSSKVCPARIALVIRRATVAIAATALVSQDPLDLRALEECRRYPRLELTIRSRLLVYPTVPGRLEHVIDDHGAGAIELGVPR